MRGQAQQKKTHFAKVRTGCLTCKARRVKCDEEKPTCRRCRVGKYKCAGYAPPKPWLFEPKSSSTAIVARPESETASQSSSSEQSTPPTTAAPQDYGSHLPPSETTDGYPLVVSQSRSPSQSSEEHQLSLFLRPTQLYGSPEEARSFQMFVENCSPLLGSYYTHDYWSVVVPQAALQSPAIKQATVAVAQNMEALRATGGAATQALRERSFQHYTAAISALLREKPGPEIILMACSLLWVSDGIHGSPAAAKTHLDGAKKIITEWRNSRTRGNARWSDNDYLIANSIMPTYKHMLEWHAKTITTKDGDDSRLRHVLLPLKSLKTRLSRRTPFSHTYEATNLLGACVQYLVLPDDPSRGENHRLPLKEVRELLFQWYLMFQETSNTSITADIRSVLGFHHLTAMLLAGSEAGIAFNPEALSVEFPDATKLREAFISNHLRSSRHFTTELGLIPPLMMFGRYAPAHGTRQEALAILRTLHCIEGAWDSCIAAEILAKVQEIEDQPDQHSPKDLKPYRQWTPVVDTVHIDTRGADESQIWVVCRTRYGEYDERQLHINPEGANRLRVLSRAAADELIRNCGYQSAPSDQQAEPDVGVCSCLPTTT